MTDIGGYFGHERFPAGGGIVPPRGLHFACGRQALLCWLSARGVGRLHLPGWTCPAVLEAADRAGVAVAFHHLGPDLRPTALPDPGPGDALLLLNACGLFDADLAAPGWPADRVIVDDTMAFFRAPRAPFASFDSWRKFLPVPDGASLCAEDVEPPQDILPGDDTYLRRRAADGAEAGRPDFLAHEAAVAGWPIAAPSDLTRTILARLDGATVRRRRRANYARLHAALGDRNALRLPDLDATAVPSAYPYLPAAGDLHEALWEQRIWAPRLWGDDPRLALDASEQRLAVDLLPLPIDHRYDEADMDRVADLVAAAEAQA